MGVLTHIEVTQGLLGGGTLGLFAARVRLRYLAEQTDTGITRRRARTGESAAEALNELEYPAVYDRYLAYGCLCVAVGALAAVPLFDPGARATIYLLTTSIVGFVSAGAAYGLASLRSGMEE
ncbi:hypothetical protein [Halobaculum lipolyticum]|uniref:Uncharacterized protein n=1 Tax=Halobaculum lipolyticum TaxID=3032001 RepID=A0ABD5WIY3_9EURY|nr:hypothetical protein [Halobaculum sp. DT31]